MMKPKDETKPGDELLKRMLKTPPKPHKETGDGKKTLTEADQKKKPGGHPAKNNRPEDQ